MTGAPRGDPMHPSPDLPPHGGGARLPSPRRSQVLIAASALAGSVLLLLDLALEGPLSQVNRAQADAVHLISEWTTFLFTLGTFVAVTLRFSRTGDVPGMVVAAGILLAGLGGGVHAVQGAGFLPAPLVPDQWCAVMWTVSRSLILILLAYAGLWLREGEGHRGRWRITTPVVVVAGIGAVIAFYVISLNFGATVIFPGTAVPRPLDLAPALIAVFLLVALAVRREPWWRRSCFGVGVYTSLFPLLLGELVLAFGSRGELDAPFLVAHVLQLLVFGLPFAGAFLDYGESLRMARETEEHLVHASSRLDESRRDRASMLRHQERRFRSVFEAAIDPIILVRLADFRILDANPSACRLLGYDRRELCALKAEAIHPNEMERLRTFALGAAAVGGARSTEFSCLTRHGDQVPVEVSASFFQTPDGGMVLVATVRDLRARLAAEAHQRQLEADLAQAARVEAVGRLAAGVAHDFNSLLTVILGLSEDLLTRTDLPPEVRQSVKLLGEVGGKASGLTQQLLAYSRNRTLTRKPLDLNDAVTAIETLLRRALPASITLRVELSDSPAWVEADPGGIDQVLMNLGLNARDAMPRGGDLVVSVVHHRVGGRGRVGTDQVGIRVADRGEGIPEEILPHIFEPFFTSKALGRGTGLGLATVHGIARQHGGAVSVSPNPGGGTVFEVLLPGSQAGIPSPPGVVPASEPVGGSLEGVHVLLADDDEMVRESLARTLGRQGMTVVKVDNADAALVYLESHGGELFDLLITDVVMPGMSGIDLARTVAARWPSLRTLIVSGYSPEGLQPVDDRMFTFLAKPFTTERLLEVVIRTLQPDPSHLATIPASESIVQVMTDGGSTRVPRTERTT